MTAVMNSGCYRSQRMMNEARWLIHSSIVINAYVSSHVMHSVIRLTHMTLMLYVCEICYILCVQSIIVAMKYLDITIKIHVNFKSNTCHTYRLG